jgi:quinol monooxygenase YgiN
MKFGSVERQRTRSRNRTGQVSSQQDRSKRPSEEAIEIVRTRDSGTLPYEILFNEDESEAVVFERYHDADAAIEHFSNMSHLMEPLLATASVTPEVLAMPNAKMKELLGKGAPKLFTPLQGQDVAEKE